MKTPVTASLVYRLSAAAGLFLMPVIGARAQSTAPAASAPATATAGKLPTSDEVISMNPFEVSTSQDYGYRKTSSVTSSKTGELITQMPQAIEVVSSELLNDFDADMGNDIFRYTSSVMVSENEVGQADVMNLRGFALPRYYNGVSLANSSSLVPINIWDNVDRIEIVKGPVGLYYPNSTPNGIANFITKKPEFTNAAEFDLTYGSFGYEKALLDDQQTLLNGKVAFRIVASASQHGSGYHDGSPTRYRFESPSVIIRPFKGLEISAEMDYLNEHNGYQGGAQAWNYSINPLWQQDLTSPTSQILSYFEGKNPSLTTDALAKAYLQTRWSPANTTAAVALATWSSDMLAITGKAPFLYTTQKINWSAYSPRGDRLDPAGLESTYGGTTPTYEASITETPFEGLSFRYHWVDQATNQEFVRQIVQPNTNGFNAYGQVNSLDASNIALQGLNYSGNNGRWDRSDTQQVDVSFEQAVASVKNQLAAGVEYLRNSSAIWVYPVNFANAGTVGGYTGVQIYQNYNPWSGATPPDVYSLVGGPPTLSAGKVNLAKDHQYYASERASFLDDRVHLLVGVNSYHVDPSGPLNTPLGNSSTVGTYGVIAEVVKGFSVFASKSSSVQFTSVQSVTGPGVLPSDNAHTLNNETDKGSEFGIKTSWDNNQVTGTVSYYDDRRDGVIEGNVLANIEDPRNANVQNVQYNVNGGLYVSRGIDADLTWTPSQNLQFVLNYNQSIEAAIRSDPSVNPLTPGTLAYQREFLYPLSHSPRERGNLVAKYTFGSNSMLNKFSVGAAVRYSSTYLVSNSSTLLLWVPTETMVDAFVSYRIKIGKIPADIKFNVTNITNVRDDYTWGDGITEYGSVTFHF